MKRWLRREVMMPLLFLVLYGGILFVLARKLQQLHMISSRSFLTWLLAACVIIYIVLLVQTLSHISTAYLLERFDPGDPHSVRRMMRKWRFRLPRHWDGSAFAVHFPLILHDDDFELEGGDRRTGLVYARAGVSFWTRRPLYDRVILLETGLINVFRVDQLLKETIDQLDHVERPSKRNVLVIAVRMANRKDVASAAAGCVNYMGRFQSGTLFPVLIDVNHRRFYFPINHSFFSREHRGLQNNLLMLIRTAGLRSLEQTPGEADAPIPAEAAAPIPLPAAPAPLPAAPIPAEAVAPEPLPAAPAPLPAAPIPAEAAAPEPLPTAPAPTADNAPSPAPARKRRVPADRKTASEPLVLPSSEGPALPTTLDHAETDELAEQLDHPDPFDIDEPKPKPRAPGRRRRK